MRTTKTMYIHMTVIYSPKRVTWPVTLPGSKPVLIAITTLTNPPTRLHCINRGTVQRVAIESVLKGFHWLPENKNPRNCGSQHFKCQKCLVC